MPYSVTCECSKVHQVSTGDAGSKLNCSCGRTVEVPSLSVLRRQAEEFSTSPELILESMLAKGELPEDSSCVECHAETDVVRYFKVVCERKELRKEVGGCGYAAYMFLFGWIVGFLYASLLNRDHKELGRDVRFRLPLRICPICDSSINKADVKRLLGQVPVYAHLLKKYPHAKITAG